MKSKPHIAVIGAGIAGLSCASTLQQADITVSLFDKSRGPGGRMSTRRGVSRNSDGGAGGGGDDKYDWQCDHGAPYFTAQHPDFQAEVSRWCKAGVAALWMPEVSVLGDAAATCHDLDAPRYVGTPKMTSPAQFLASAVALTLQTTIQQIESQTDGWRLQSAEQGWLNDCFDAVLLAIPAPQAVPLLLQPAPAWAALAATAKMRSCWTLMLQFATRVALPFDVGCVSQGPLAWIARDRSKPGREGAESWVLHASAAWSATHLEDDTATVAALLVQAFIELGGPAPQTWTAHRWRYAHAEPGLDKVYVWDGANKIGLCGDWLNEGAAGGSVESAWQSGRDLAQQVQQSLDASCGARPD